MIIPVIVGACALLSSPLAVGAQGKFPSGAKGFNLWQGPTSGSYYGVAVSGSSWYVATASGSFGPFTSVSPVRNGDTVPVTSFIVKDASAWYLLGPAGEKLGPYAALTARAEKKDAPEHKGRLYAGKRKDGVYELLLDDGVAVKSLGEAEDVFLGAAAIGVDGASAAVKVERRGDKGVLWDGLFIPLPLLSDVCGIAYGGSVLIVSEYADGKEWLVALTRGDGEARLAAVSSNPGFYDLSGFPVPVPLPEGYGRYGFGAVAVTKSLGMEQTTLRLEFIEKLQPIVLLSGSHGFALRYRSGDRNYALTEKGRFGPFLGAAAADNAFVESPSGEAFGFSSGPIQQQYVHVGNTSWGPLLMAVYLTFDREDRLYFIGVRMSGEVAYRESEAVSRVGDTTQLVKTRRVDPRTGAETVEPFDGYFSVAKDDKTTLYRVGGPDGTGELVAGPYDGEYYAYLYRFGGLQRVVFRSRYGSTASVVVDGVQLALTGSPEGFAFSSDGASFAFLEAREDAGVYLHKDAVVLGPFKACGYPAFVPGTTELVFASRGKGGLTLTRGDGKPVSLKGSRMDPEYPGGARVSPDGSVVELSFYAKVPGSAKDADLVPCSEVVIGGVVYSGDYDERSGATVYWDPKAKRVVTLGGR
jgi:hypothetical protein